jgi:hypothetical protein
VWAVFTDFGSLVSPLLIGVLYDTVNPLTGFLAVGGGLLAAALLTALFGTET